MIKKSGEESEITLTQLINRNLMRDYQIKQNVGGVADSDLPTKDGANEYNSLRTENKEAVSRAGLTLTPQDGTSEDTTQLSQSLMINGAGASSFQAAGTVDAITLTPVTGISGLKLSPDYATFHGFRVGFYPIGSNTGNVTISVGQDAGSQFSVKKALNEDGTELPAATLSDAIYAEFIYDETADTSNGAFVLIPYSLASGGGGVNPGDPTIAVSPDDTTLGDLETKLVAGTNITLTTLNPGGNETLEVNADADTGKVDKDLTSDPDYPPTTVIDDTDLFYLMKAGVAPGKMTGLALKDQLAAVDVQELTSSGIWTKPSSGSRVLVQQWAGGGSGGRAGAADGGGGGGGGAYIEAWFDIDDLGATETVTIGAGGAAITTDDTDGNDGGNTTFGSLLTIFGGGGGGGNTTDDGGGGGGGGTTSAGSPGIGNLAGDGGDPFGGSSPNLESLLGGGGGSETTGQAGGNSVYGGAGGGQGQNADVGAPGDPGGNSIYGSGGGGGADANTPGTGGTSVTGGVGGAGAASAAAATDGAQPGGGGGGSQTGNSGAGGDGLCIVTTF